MTTEELQYKVLTSVDMPEVLQLMEHHFLPRNPLAKAAKETSVSDFGGELEDDIRQCLISGVSVGVSVSGALVGIGLSTITTKDVDGKEEPPKSKCYKLLDQLHAGVNLFKQENVTKILKMFVMTVHSDYCRRGIAGTLVKKTIALGEEYGCQLVFGDVTITLMSKVVISQGFWVVQTLDLTMVDGLDHSLIPGETQLKLMVARLPMTPIPAK